MDLVVDTYVICKAGEPFDPQYMSAITFLHLIMESPHRIAMDAETYIDAQYRTYIRRSPHLEPWWNKMLFHAGNVSQFSGKCTQAVSSKLAELRFDSDDHPFVGVAYRCNGDILVAEESDYSEPVRSYLASIGIRVVSIAEAIQLVR